MRIIVGCPAYKRDWILPDWFDAIEAGFAPLEIEPEFAFVLDMNDEATIEVVFERAKQLEVAFVNEHPLHSGKREWSLARYGEMVSYRNSLLSLVRQERPDYFLSIDSDILLHRDTMKNLLETIENFDAVAGKVYLSEINAAGYGPSDITNWCKIGRGGTLVRQDSDGVFPVEVIMALKLMKPQAYSVDYEVAEQGEDIGWSLACHRNGLRLGWDGRVPNKHIMNPNMLTQVDARCGY